ncbi:MAG: M23 family metallopeptidase [Candidatus Dormibacteria bacterium]
MRIPGIAMLVVGLLTVAVPVSAAGTAHPTPGASPSAAPSPAVDPLAQQLQAALAQQAQLEAAKSALAGQVQAAHDQQANLRSLVATGQQAIDTTVAQAAVAEQQLQTAQTRAAAEHASAEAARRHADEDRALLALYTRARYTDNSGMLTYVLSSSDLSSAFARAASMNKVVDGGEQLLSRLKADIAAADAAEAAAQKDAATAQAEAARLLEQQAQLEQQTAHENDLIGQLDAQAQAAAREIQAANGQGLGLVQQIAQLRIEELDSSIAQASDADWKAAQYYLEHHLGSVPVLSGAAAHPGVRFVWPAPGTLITQAFGPSAYPFEPAAFGFPHFHTGLDMAGPMGTPIYAAGDGVVVVADSSSVGYGNHLILAHDTLTFTLYGHLETMLVKPGDTVHAGQLIALMGSTGNSTGSHTHFEVRVSGQPVDPAAFLPPLAPGASGPPPLPTH